jgi:hypothetical protein
MNRERDAYCIDFQSLGEARRWYDEHKKYITGEGSSMYDYVLVEAPRTRTGHTFKLRLFWHPYRWMWRPRIQFRFGFSFVWFGVQINANREYDNIPGKIIRDHNNPPTQGEKEISGFMGTIAGGMMVLGGEVWRKHPESGLLGFSLGAFCLVLACCIIPLMKDPDEATDNPPRAGEKETK